MINKADLVVMIIILFAVVSGAKTGFLRNAAGFLSNIISLAAAKFIVPYLTLTIRHTPLFDAVKKHIASELDMDSRMHLAAATQKAQSDIISGLSIPDFIKLALLENNNSEIHNILNTDSLADYITGYISNILLNAVISVIAIIALWIIIQIFLGSLKSIARLPIIRTADMALGGIFGFFQAAIMIWIFFVIIFVFNMGDNDSAVLDEINNSVIASEFYVKNIFMDTLMKII